jgi:hypothetical protein
MKVTTTMSAYLSPFVTLTPQELQTPAGASQMTYAVGKSKYWAEQGYTYVGEAEVAVEVPDIRELVESKVEALREQATAIRAEATAKCTVIDGQIQNLLAIEYTPAAGAEA